MQDVGLMELRQSDVPLEAMAEQVNLKDLETLGVIIMVHWLACLPVRCQIIVESTIDEFERATTREGEAVYRMRLKGRPFKTVGRSSTNKLPPKNEWMFGVELSMMLHVYLLLRPMLCRPSVPTKAMFLNTHGAAMSHKTFRGVMQQLGSDWLGVPHLSPGAFRTMVTTRLAQTGVINAGNVDMFASLLQTSVSAIHSNYLGRVSTPAVDALQASLWQPMSGGVAVQPMAPPVNSKRPHSAAFDDEPNAPPKKKTCPRNVNAARALWSSNIKDWAAEIKATGLDVSKAWEDLCTRRKNGLLKASEVWASYANTFLSDGKAGARAIQEKILQKSRRRTSDPSKNAA
jgi:hypothetical protein